MLCSFFFFTTVVLTDKSVLKEPAPGCVDQKLSKFAVSQDGVLRHEELPIPPTSDTPYALEVLLDRFRQQFLNMIDMFKNSEYKDVVNKQIEEEKVCCTSHILVVSPSKEMFKIFLIITHVGPKPNSRIFKICSIEKKKNQCKCFRQPLEQSVKPSTMAML